jgi:hypothetical protein
MNREFGNDMTEQQMAVISRHRVDAIFAQQARPRKSHQPSQLVALALVGAVVYVLRRKLDKQAGALQQGDSYAVGRGQRILRVDDFVDEDRDDIVGTVLIRHGGAADELRILAFLEAHGETRYDN